MLLYLARHGKTDYNALGFCQGQLDLPLNAEGRAQAQLLGEICKDLPLTNVFTSPLSRTYETAEVVMKHHPHLELEVAQPLINQYWGSTQGTPNPINFDPDAPIPADVEPYSALEKRVQDWLKIVIDKFDPENIDAGVKVDDKVVLAVSHEDPITAIRNIFLRTDNGLGVVTEVAEGVDSTARPANTKLGLLKIWRDGGSGGSSVLRARLEVVGRSMSIHADASMKRCVMKGHVRVSDDCLESMVGPSFSSGITLEMLLYLVRHGQTDHNVNGRIQGRLDIPLNETGLAQARHLAKSGVLPRFDRICSSGLQRARQTAEVIRNAQDLQGVHIDELLTERDWGHLQGAVYKDDMTVPDDGESDETLSKRLSIWLDQLIMDHSPATSPTGSPTDIVSSLDQSDNVLVVTHQDCIMTLLNILTPPTGSDSPLSISIGPDVDLTRPCGNTFVATVRIWWESGGKRVGELRPVGRIEAWGVGDAAAEV